MDYNVRAEIERGFYERQLHCEREGRMNHNMDKFMNWILTEMSATKFLEYLQKSRLPRDEQRRLYRLAWSKETEMIAYHVENPNEY